jgi:hypothetical protein
MSINKFCPPFLSPAFMSAIACCNLSAGIFFFLSYISQVKINSIIASVQSPHYLHHIVVIH